MTEAHHWYESECSGLGRRFLGEVDDAIERMRSSPKLFPTVHRNVQRALLRRFPYALLFVTERDQSLTVLACFHSSRNPLRWQERV